MVRILVVGVSYKTASVDVRERIFFPDNLLDDALVELHCRPGINECCIISTCNRVEIYAVTEDFENSQKEIVSFITEFTNQPESTIKSKLYTLSDGEAVKHLFRVTSSMDSMIVGEPQIVGQVKQFYKTAYNNKTVGLILNRLFQTAFFVAKKIRSHTDIGARTISISYLAVELSKRIFEDLRNRKVMLIGTGEMSQLAAKHLISNGIKELYIASRNYNNAVELSENLNGIPLKLEETLYNLKNVDIVITATGSSEYIIKSENIKESLKLRKNDPIFLIDIAVPRDIDPRINDISGVYLYDIDDLNAVLDKNLNTRKENLDDAENIVVEVQKSYLDWLDSLKIFPTIVGLKNKFEEIKSNELNKAYNKFDNLSEKDREIVENLVQSIVSKIFHSPTTNLKKEASSYDGMVYSEVIKKLFDIDYKGNIVDLNDVKSRK